LIRIPIFLHSSNFNPGHWVNVIFEWLIVPMPIIMAPGTGNFGRRYPFAYSDLNLFSYLINLGESIEHAIHQVITIPQLEIFKCLVGKLFEQQNGVNWEKGKLPLLIKWR
jgi:hypothetical protein